ncbi:hypothetical protein CEW87_08720 [Parazoarcus communis]|uniref:Lipoprotein n=1 Tax=Parazoarcus communis TaxID=41977 RepID=A0A2U8H148_9RHOO|nr:DUF6279 family lipoprotein [Parazoarcus communis]AWI79444.1 hypothetical protein CEW87_08720 [Parazoarcus communis]
MSVRLRLLVLSFCVLLLGGCGLRFAYSQLDWLLPWYLGDYVSLDQTQKRLLDARLGERLAWHCGSQLTAYSGLLRDVERDLRSTEVVAAPMLDTYLQRGEAFWRVLMKEITPDAGVLLAALSDAQVKELGEAFARRNDETREEFLEGTPEALRARQIERMEKRLRTWFGPLSAAQRSRVAAWSAGLAPATEAWLQHRVRWQGALIDVLAQRQQPGFESRVGALLLEPESMWAAAYRADVARNRKLTLDLLAETFNMASPAQRTHLFNEIAGWAAQFEQLACTDTPLRTASGAGR